MYGLQLLVLHTALQQCTPNEIKVYRKKRLTIDYWHCFDSWIFLVPQSVFWRENKNAKTNHSTFVSYVSPERIKRLCEQYKWLYYCINFCLFSFGLLLLCVFYNAMWNKLMFSHVDWYLFALLVCFLLCCCSEWHPILFLSFWLARDLAISWQHQISELSDLLLFWPVVFRIPHEKKTEQFYLCDL